MTAPIGLFYGSSTCYTEMTAEKIQRRLGEGMVDVFNIADTPIATTADYEYIILGIPTWDYGELQEDWEDIWDDIDDVDFTGKKVAIYGQGDQEGYPEWFLDAMGFLWGKVATLGATTVGLWPNEGYQFDNSKALTQDGKYFVGLALDDENEFDLSEDRLEKWCNQIMSEFGLGE